MEKRSAKESTFQSQPMRSRHPATLINDKHKLLSTVESIDPVIQQRSLGLAGARPRKGGHTK